MTDRTDNYNRHLRDARDAIMRLSIAPTSVATGAAALLRRKADGEDIPAAHSDYMANKAQRLSAGAYNDGNLRRFREWRAVASAMEAVSASRLYGAAFVRAALDFAEGAAMD